MAMSTSDVTHDHGITREVYEVTRLYAETVKRLRTVNTNEDSISEDFYMAALRLYADTLMDPIAQEHMSDSQRRETLCALATVILRWARKVRIGTYPDLPPLAITDDRTSDDT